MTEISTRAIHESSSVGLGRLTIRLGLFVVLAGFVLNVVLYFGFGFDTTLHQSVDLLTWTVSDDSWEPIRVAHGLVNVVPHEPLYTTTVFGFQSKFQYPLTSLLVLDPFLRLEDALNRPELVLNVISWFLVFGTATLAALMFVRGAEVQLHGVMGRLRADRMILAGIAMAAVLSFQPIVASFSLGQIQTWLNFFFCAAAFAWMCGRKGWAGVLTAAICLVKPQLILLLLWALLRREWRYFWFAAIPFGVVFAASFAAYGLRDYLDYFSLLSFLSAHGEGYHDNQSVNGLLNRLFQNGNNLVWAQASFAPYNPWIHAATVATSAVLIGTALFWRRREHERASLVDFLIAALSFTMASPIAWSHHYGIMVAMFAVALPATLGSARFGTGSVVLLAVSYLLSATYLKVTDLAADTSFNFVQSYLFFGAILLLVHLYRLRHAQQDAPASAAPASESTLSGQTAGAGS